MSPQRLRGSKSRARAGAGVWTRSRCGALSEVAATRLQLLHRVGVACDLGLRGDRNTVRAVCDL
eukprot:scaffold14757_cov111-Isochrysis_galbana.AAC.9